MFEGYCEYLNTGKILNLFGYKQVIHHAKEVDEDEKKNDSVSGHLSNLSIV